MKRFKEKDIGDNPFVIAQLPALSFIRKDERDWKTNTYSPVENALQTLEIDSIISPHDREKAFVDKIRLSSHPLFLYFKKILYEDISYVKFNKKKAMKWCNYNEIQFNDAMFDLTVNRLCMKIDKEGRFYHINPLIIFRGDFSDYLYGWYSSKIVILSSHEEYIEYIEETD